MQIYELVLEKKVKEFGDIYSFYFSTNEKIEFQSGQWVHLGFPTGQKDKSRVHHMSFASAPHEPHLQFTMDISSGSWFKNAISSMNQNDIIKAFKISGEFIIDPSSSKHVVLIAGGLGITPMRSMLLDLAYKGQANNISLLHVARDAFLYQDELSKIDIPQYRVNRQGIDDVWSKLTEQAENKKYYICGSNRFVSGMIEKLNHDNIHDIVTEDFM